MADQPITSATFVAVTTPGVACKMQVLDAPVCLTFTAGGTETRGFTIQPGHYITISATDAPRARRLDHRIPTLIFEVFG